MSGHSLAMPWAMGWKNNKRNSINNNLQFDTSDWNTLQLHAANLLSHGWMNEALRLFRTALEVIPVDERSSRAKTNQHFASLNKFSNVDIFALNGMTI